MEGLTKGKADGI